MKDIIDETKMIYKKNDGTVSKIEGERNNK